MATIMEIPDPRDVEDTAVRFATPAEEDGRGLFRKFIKRTYTLTSGTNSGSDVDYVAEEVAVTVTSAPTTAVTIADGSDVAEGATTSAESTSGNGTVIGILKNLRTRVTTLATLLAGGLPVALGTAGGLKVEQTPYTVVQNSSVNNAVADTALLLADPDRRGVCIFNNDTAGTGATLNVMLGGFAASATDFTVRIPPQGYYEVPFGATDAVRGYATAATGEAHITVWE